MMRGIFFKDFVMEIKKHILVGSLEMNGNIIRGGVFVGQHEWDIHNLKFIEGVITKVKMEGQTVEKFLFDLYDSNESIL